MLGGKLGNPRPDLGEIMIRAFFIIAFAATALLVPSEGSTKNALTADTLMGRWCGDVSAYTFTRDKLTVTFFDGRAQSILRIKAIEIHNDVLTVVWDPRDGDKTDFAEFAGKSMVQPPTTGGDVKNRAPGPRRVFHRC
jgi:hypothetical protein